jgi:hypothetical protein
MKHSGLRLLTVMVVAVMAVVPFLGLDDLPRGTRSAIDAERSALASTTAQIQRAKDEVGRELQSDADIFRSVPASQQWPATLAGAQTVLQAANRDAQQLAALEKQNRRGDRQEAERLLADERQLRTSARNQAASVQNDASHWVDLKRHLPEDLQQMARDYQAIHGFDLTALNTAVERAETDWPEKKASLDERVASVKQIEARGDQIWQSSAEERRLAAAGDFAHLNFGALGADADALKAAAADLPRQTTQITALTGQLYNSWDKLLVDMRRRGNTYDQEIRTVTTHLPDAAAKSGDTTSEERWVEVSPATYQAMRNDLGMAIEHKPAGKYDSEADRVAQPAGFAYVAPNGQSNQYGYWDHGGGHDFWVFYGQYALMRDLLFNHSYRPLDRSEWEDYRSYQRTGRTYYGNDYEAGLPKYGSQGTATADRYSGSAYAKSGGFKDSKYASKGGNYRDSRFATPGAGDPNADHSPKRFGSGSARPDQPHFNPPSRPSAPRPSFRPPSSGRRFGRH